MKDQDKNVQGFTQVMVSESYHPFWKNWWPQGHIIGWEHTFVHELNHFLDAVVNQNGTRCGRMAPILKMAIATL